MKKVIKIDGEEIELVLRLMRDRGSVVGVAADVIGRLKLENELGGHHEIVVAEDTDAFNFDVTTTTTAAEQMRRFIDAVEGAIKKVKGRMREIAESVEWMLDNFYQLAEKYNATVDFDALDRRDDC